MWGGDPACEHEWVNESVEAENRTGQGLAEWSAKNAAGGGHKNGQIGKYAITHGTCVKCGAWRGAFGLEPDYQMYVEHMIIILREIRRVLRPDGVLFLNIGDCYATGGGKVGDCPGGGAQGERWATGGHRGMHTESNSGMQGYVYNHATNTVDPKSKNGIGPMTQPNRMPQFGLKPKDLSMIPARVALAAQADGWWLRSDIIWAKPNPMPESVTDRPTDSYEHIFMLTKSEHYFWDADAVREPLQKSSLDRGYSKAYMDGVETAPKMRDAPKEVRAKADWRARPYIPSGRNIRNVWTFATQPYSGAHFATFPEELPRRCILAATSAKGACAQCGAPWERVSRSTTRFESGSGKAGTAREDIGGKWEVGGVNGNANIKLGPVVDVQTVGWMPTCLCKGQRSKTVPCVVLDPFGGSGTTGRVAAELKRQCYLFDIAYEAGGYDELAKKRTTNVQLTMTELL